MAASARPRVITTNQIAVTQIDPFIASHSVPENDNTAMEVVIKTWAAIAAQTNTSIEIKHHTRKPLRGGQGDNSASDARGASAVIDGLRSARTINRMTQAEAETARIENNKAYFKVESGKANMRGQDGKPAWFKLVSVILPNFDNVGTIVTWKAPEAFELTLRCAVRSTSAPLPISMPSCSGKVCRRRAKFFGSNLARSTRPRL
jgi:hypothetical protein